MDVGSSSQVSVRSATAKNDPVGSQASLRSPAQSREEKEASALGSQASLRSTKSSETLSLVDKLVCLLVECLMTRAFLTSPSPVVLPAPVTGVSV